MPRELGLLAPGRSWMEAMDQRDEKPTFVGTANLDRLAEIPDDRHRQAVERAIDRGLEAADSVQERTISTFSRGYQPAFAGVNTFLKAPYLEDVKQVGAPTRSRSWAPPSTWARPSGRAPRWAPQAVRRISAVRRLQPRHGGRPVRGARHRRRRGRVRDPLQHRRPSTRSTRPWTADGLSATGSACADEPQLPEAGQRVLQDQAWAIRPSRRRKMATSSTRSKRRPVGA